MKLARIERSSQEIESLALAVSKHPELIMKTKNIMGVSVPRIEGFGIHRNLNEKGFGYVDLPAALLEAADAYEELVDYVVLAAEVETSMKKILLEIDHTKRRVNALEYRLIPQMQSVQSFIQLRLEEIERETVFRTKLIKKRLA